MLVKQLVGRLAGFLIDLPVPEAQSCLDMGTVLKPTDSELEAYADGDDGPFDQSRPSHKAAAETSKPVIAPRPPLKPPETSTKAS